MLLLLRLYPLLIADRGRGARTATATSAAVAAVAVAVAILVEAHITGIQATRNNRQNNSTIAPAHLLRTITTLIIITTGLIVTTDPR